MLIDPDEIIGEDTDRKFKSACPNLPSQMRTKKDLHSFANSIRKSVNQLLGHINTITSSLNGAALKTGFVEVQSICSKR